MIDYETGKEVEEKIYGEWALKLLYAPNPLSRLLKNFVSRLPLVSKTWGGWQTLPWTRKKVAPFVKKYQLNAAEFEKKVEEFSSFNDFFIRKLKKEARPILGPICMPADGRYLAFQNIAKAEGFFVKGQKFSISSLLQDPLLAGSYQNGSLILARLAPVDYHRFHFPVACTPQKSQLINGALFSVNPLALKQNIHRLTENKRVVTRLQSDYGTILMIEIGATNVGSIHQTYTPQKSVREGDEKGFFSFGGSAIALLFPPNAVQLDFTLLDNSEKFIETRCLMGQILARPLK